MKYDAVLFDLDGTLTESEPGIVNSVKYALEKMNRTPPPREQLTSFIGPPLLESFLRTGLTDGEARQAVEHYRERFSQVGWKENSVYRGIPGILRELKEAGAYVAVATAKPLEFSRRILDYFAMAPFIDRLEAISLTDHHADKGEIIRRALPEKYERACMVGDRAGDMVGARENGVDAIGALYGYGSLNELEEAGATRVAEDVSALRQILLGDGAKPARGLFITFEGSDGCGKSTQARLANQWLNDCGYETVFTREPGGCPISEKIRSIILDVENKEMTDECEALLYAAARAQHVSQVIAPAVEEGKIVLSDRFVDSSVAYQGGGRNLGVDLIRRINEPAVGGMIPDLTLLYDLPPMKAMERRLAASQPDRMEMEKRAFVERVYSAYLDIAAREAERIIKINGDRPVEAVQADTRQALTTHLTRNLGGMKDGHV